MTLLKLISIPLFFYLQVFTTSNFGDKDKVTYAQPIKNYTYKVIEIKDGDTFVVLYNNTKLVIRLAHIDCPEKKQPFYVKAKQFAAQLCFGKKVTLIHNNNYDRNKRLIAEVVIAENNLNINKALVKNGLAWHFKKYSSSIEYATLETEARNKKIGLWSTPNAIDPWNWRKNKYKQ